MPTTKSVAVHKLSLDLENFRTVKQPDEVSAVQAMVSISPDRFWALAESLITDGYLPTENILVLEEDSNPQRLAVREGNRRIAVLKLAHGLIPLDDVEAPDSIVASIKSLPEGWKTANASVPCAVYPPEDAAVVDRIVALAHGKGEKAAKDQWNAVARARHNRDEGGASEPALDCLEKYLSAGSNLTPQQGKKWAGDYPLTVLEEAIKKLATRLGSANSVELAKAYPKITHKTGFDAILLDIGLQHIRFETIRNKEIDFAAKYGIPPLQESSGDRGESQAGTGGAQSSDKPGTSSGSDQSQQDQSKKTNEDKTKATAVGTPASVKATLRKFKPLGGNRAKVVTLRDEAKRLNLKNNPIAFCFLLRSMFEISAKAYCDDHNARGGPVCTDASGKDRRLVDLLKDVTEHLITLPNNKPDLAKVKTLHGALTELSKPEGILSVTSMNQLVHNPAFSVTTSDVCTLFGNVFPLLSAMNQ